LRLDVRKVFVLRTRRGIESMKARGLADPGLDAEYTAESLGAMLEYICYMLVSPSTTRSTRSGSSAR